MLEEKCFDFRLFAFLSFFQVGQFLVGFCFSVIIFSRIICPESLGLWASLGFLFNLYFIFVDFGLETIIFLETKLNEENNCVFNSAFFFRIFFSILPFLVLVSLSYFIVKINSTIIFFAIFFFLEKMTTLGKYWIDSVGEQNYQSRIEFFSLLFGNFLCLLFYPMFNPNLVLSIQKISEKLFLFIFEWKLFPKMGYRYFRFEVVKKSFNLLGLPTLKSGFSSLFIHSFYPFLLSFFLGSYTAGIFAKSFSLACLPLLLTTVCNRITTPLYGRRATNFYFKKIFLTSFFVKLIILVPCLAILFLSAHLWVPKLLGSQWAMVVPCYRILSLYSFSRCFYDDLGPLFNLALGSPDLFSKNQVFHAQITIFTIPIIFLKKSIFIACFLSSFAMALTTLKLFGIIWKIMKIEKNDFFILCKKPLIKS